MNYDVFISYSRKDTEVAEKICSALDKYGISYFIDRKGIGGGMEFPAVIADAIMSSKLMLFLGSENSYKSKFTNIEVTFAFNEKPVGSIVPYIIDGSKLPAALKFTFSNINIRTLEEHPIDTILIQDLCQILDRPFAKKEKQSNKISVTVKDSRITLEIIDRFSFVLEKDTINNVFIGNIPVREILDSVKSGNGHDGIIANYLQTAFSLAAIPLSPILASAYFAYRLIMKRNKLSEVESKAFDAIISEINHRYNIFLEKLPEKIKNNTSIPLTDFAVLLDLSKIENSQDSLIERLKAL